MQCTRCPAFWMRPMAKARPAREPRRNKKKNETDTKTTPETQKRQRDEESGSTEDYPVPPLRQENPKIVATSLTDLIAPSKDGHCPVCGAAVTISGPLYCAPTQNRDYLAELLEVIAERDKEGRITSTARIQGLVQVALEELPQSPLFYVLPEVASYVRVRCPPSPLFIGALGRLGYTCSQVHCDAAGLKTNCPPEVLFRVMLAWKKKCDEEDLANGEERKESHDGEDRKPILLAPLDGVDFSYDKRYDLRRQATGMAKYIPNAPGWGPKRRHQGAQQMDENDHETANRS
ncbi:putative N(2),N(2)-dimethylguanosine tRNA methyltransferase [Angomonas deanei]|uniref:tRNA (guanine(26)-N(2))-dimethyltransferase n=1 Tax=Angomonas deanei TaxID=59799 RepID=A0A7G2CKZ3_9TRYP|nr:putative N(2),N(2)-dimethylguanosine tRNA methyltransferase [Angomonas deanei]CAD2219601.1 N2,N2-dimethylguanosine tRNA methyltransferase, putative [Angomonas deanei]|eukprot:EPY19675.1 putative N(2),N(2)-dimethylguanosine tRNA methyltransferase [Angomonas deanei]